MRWQTKRFQSKGGEESLDLKQPVHAGLVKFNTLHKRKLGLKPQVELEVQARLQWPGPVGVDTKEGW